MWRLSAWRMRFLSVRHDRHWVGVRDAADIERVLKYFAQEPNGGLIVTPSPLTATKRDVLIDVADKVKLLLIPFLCRERWLGLLWN